MIDTSEKYSFKLNFAKIFKRLIRKLFYKNNKQQKNN